jgi:DNA-binding MarR family transcriptional regulator
VTDWTRDTLLAFLLQEDSPPGDAGRSVDQSRPGRPCWTNARFQALEVLVENGPLLMRKMSDAMLVTPANVTGIVDRLEEKSRVTRSPGKADVRATMVVITPAGRRSTRGSGGRRQT